MAACLLESGRRKLAGVLLGSIRRYCVVQTEKVEPTKLSVKTRMYNYLKMIYEDYKLAAIEVFTDAKSKPLKATLYTCTVAGAVHLWRHNPNEEHYMQRLLLATNDLWLVSDALRNKACEAEVKKLVKAKDAGLLRRTNLGIFSLIWHADYSRSVDVYAAHCSKVSWRWYDFSKRVVDIGILDKWFLIDRLMVDYDVNVDEWVEVHEQDTSISQNITKRE